MERHSIAEDAAEWLIRLEEDRSPGCCAQFTAWLRQSPDHMEQFLLVTAAYRELDALDAGKAIDIEELTDAFATELEGKVVELGVPRPAPGLFTAAPLNKRKLLGSLAAAVAVAGLMGWFWTAFIATADYRTAVGEQRAVKLGDGSMVQLNTRSRVAVKFSSVTREVRLVEGEALFVVEKDAKRPFRVVTPDATIQALGTQFNVYRHPGWTAVSVLEGRVRIENVQGRRDFAAGEGARIGETGRIEKEPTMEVAQAVAWRQRKLDFRGTPLREIAAEFNRYNRLQIQVEDDIAGNKELNGVFSADEPRSLLKFLEEDPQLAVEQRAGKLIVRSRSGAEGL